MGPIRRTASRFLRSAEGRAILYQAAIVGAVLATLYAVTRRAVELLAERGVRSGFGFLSDRAGFHANERILLPRLDPELLLFAGSVAAGVLAAWGLTRWAARRGTPAAADTRLAVLRVAVLFGIPAAALTITGSGIEMEQLTSEITFRQALAVGILNTLRVSAVALVLSTIVGMIVALMRLSPNCVLRAIGRAYVELICNMPLLLHVFLWLAVLFSVQPERQSLSSGDVTFIDNRGIYLPAIDAAPGLAPFCIAAASALFLGWLAVRLGRDHMERTGRRVPVLPICLALLVGLPGAAVLFFGAPFTHTLPVLERFNIRDAVVLTPAFVGLVVAMTVYYGAYAADIIRNGIQSLRADVVVEVVQLRRPAQGQGDAPRRSASGHPGDHSADGQPLSGAHQEQLSGRGGRLSRDRDRRRRHRVRHRSVHRDPGADHGVLSLHQPERLDLGQMVQRQTPAEVRRN